MWPKDSVAQLLGIAPPIIQAPMSGVTTPELAAAVSNAGALGSLGCATMPGAAIREQIGKVRAATNRPFNVNFFVHAKPTADAGATKRMHASLTSYYAEFGLGAVPDPAEPFPPFSEDQLAAVLETRPRVVSFHFGLPAPEAVQRIKATGALVISSATTVAEACELERRGADIIVAQGAEAGGHRGTFSDDPGAGSVGTFSLVPQIVDAVKVPVIAAGGIADGRGIAAAFALGARGVQIGTAFLGAPEAAMRPAYREALSRAKAEDTRITRVFTGRPARALRCRLTDEVTETDTLAFPLQASLLAPLWGVNDDKVQAAFTPFWAGQSVALMRRMPAAKLVETLAAEAQVLMPH